MFLLFAGDAYYPSGGWGDFIQAFETLEGAKEWYAENQRVAEEQRGLGWKPNMDWKHRFDWAQIVDTETMEEIDYTDEKPFKE
jgi:hypothetical protein